MKYFLFSAILAWAATNGTWRAATESELRELIPARASVAREQIETEFRTASGIRSEKGKYVAGVVLITAGYAADGKYSNLLLAQTPIKIGELSLQAGEYVFGWRRNGEDSLIVKFYDARSEKYLGDAEAKRLTKGHRVESFRISPPAENPVIQVGRFGLPYRLID